MSIDITVTVGGAAGQGLQTVGDLLARVCHRAGLYLMAINDFESRIRGGNNFFQIRISDAPVNAPRQPVDLLVALDRRSIREHRPRLSDRGLIMADAGSSNKGEKGEMEGVFTLPIRDLAKEAGGAITANTVAAGACLAILGAPWDLVRETVEDFFSGKSRKVIDQNIAAAEKGHEAGRSVKFQGAFQWPDGRERKGRLLTGADAAALGALAADCRIAAFYPMSPATPILVSLASHIDRFPLVLEQAEDEIAAVNMTMGAAFAGVRAFTATSGGGFALMTEGLGLAGITETPIVIVNAQRPGPATGLPTRTGQADLPFCIHSPQDDSPRFILAPGTVEDVFNTMVRAFDLAWKYQAPAIVLVDQYLCDSMFIALGEMTVPESIPIYTITDADMPDPSAYQRYAFTESGISPMALPCAGQALVKVCGNEHRVDGHITEDATLRRRMVEKRQSKIPAMRGEMRPPSAHHPDAETLLVGWGSTIGPLREAVDMLRSDGMDAGCAHFTDLWPFPAEAAERVLKKAGRRIMVEGNATAQLGALIREQTGIVADGTVLKYDGRPFFPREIADAVLEQTR